MVAGDSDPAAATDPTIALVTNIRGATWYTVVRTGTDRLVVYERSLEQPSAASATATARSTPSFATRVLPAAPKS
jgi:hypothetical protein